VGLSLTYTPFKKNDNIEIPEGVDKNEQRGPEHSPVSKAAEIYKSSAIEALGLEFTVCTISQKIQRTDDSYIKSHKEYIGKINIPSRKESPNSRETDCSIAPPEDTFRKDRNYESRREKAKDPRFRTIVETLGRLSTKCQTTKNA
jgi:hypothetical protein